MIATNHDITIDRAADYEFYLTINGGDGSSIDVSAADFYSEIRDKTSRKTVVTLTCTPSVDPVNEVVCALSTTQTKTLVADADPDDDARYEWDLFMVRSGVTTRLLYGDAFVRDNHTTGSPID